MSEKKRKHHYKYCLQAPAGFLRLQPTCKLPLGGPGGVLPGPTYSNLLHRRQVGVGMTRQPPRAPAGATCAIPFFDPLEAEFEKVVFTKVVALAMFYLVVFEKIKKLIFKLSTAIFGQLEHGTNRLEPGHFSRSNSRGLFFDFEFFSIDFRCSKGVKTIAEI